MIARGSRGCTSASDCCRLLPIAADRFQWPPTASDRFRPLPVSAGCTRTSTRACGPCASPICRPRSRRRVPRVPSYVLLRVNPGNRPNCPHILLPPTALTRRHRPNCPRAPLPPSTSELFSEQPLRAHRAPCRAPSLVARDCMWQVRALVIINPGNPTGQCMSKAEVRSRCRRLSTPMPPPECFASLMPPDSLMTPAIYGLLPTSVIDAHVQILIASDRVILLLIASDRV